MAQPLGPRQRRATTLSSILFIAFLAISVSLGSVLGERVDGAFSQLRTEIQATLSGEVAIDVTWDSFAPSPLRGLEVRGVAFGDTLSVASLSIDATLLDILRGQPADARYTIRAARGVLRVDRPEDAPRIERVLAFIADVASGQPDVRFVVDDFAIRAARDGLGAELRNVSADVLYVDRARIVGTVDADIAGSFPIAGEQLFVGMSTSIDVSGSIPDGTFALGVELRDVEGSTFTMETQYVRIDVTPDTFTATRVRSSDALNLSATFERESGNTAVRIETAALRGRDVVTLRGAWERWMPYLEPAITTTSTISIDADGSLRATGRLGTTVRGFGLPHAVSVAGNYTATPTRVVVSGASISGRGGTALVDGSFDIPAAEPNGRVVFDRFVWADLPEVHGTVDVASTGGIYGFSAPRMEVNGVPLYETNGRVTQGARYWSVSAATQLARTDSAISVDARVAGPDDLVASVRADAVAPLRVLRLADALGVTMPIPAAVSDVLDPAMAVVDLDARVSLLNGEVDIDLPLVRVTDRRSPDRVLTASGTYRNDVITVTQARVPSPLGPVTTFGRIIIADPARIAFYADVAFLSYRYTMTGRLLDGTVLELRTTDDIELRVTRGSNGAVSLVGRVVDLTLPDLPGSYTGSVEGAWFGPDDWYAAVTEGVARDVKLPGERSLTVHGAVSARPGVAHLMVVDAGDEISRLAGSLRVTGHFADRDLAFEGGFGALDSNERYRLRGTVKGDAIALDASVGASPIRRFSPRYPRGTVTGTVRATGTIPQPRISARVATDEWFIGDEPARASADVAVTPEAISIANGQFAFAEAVAAMPVARLDRLDGAIVADIDFQRGPELPAYVVRIDGSAPARAALTLDALLDLPVTLNADVASDEEQWNARIVRADRQTTISRIDGAFDVVVSDDGRFSGRVGAPFPFAARGEGRVRDGEIELTATGIEADLPGLLSEPLPADVVLERGRVRGNARLLGPISDPSVFGTLTAEDVVMSAPIVTPDTITVPAVTVIIEEKSARIRPATGTIGAQPFTVSGAVALDRVSLAEYRIEVSTEAEPGARVIAAFGGVSVDGFARGTVTLTGVPDAVAIGGDLTFSATELGLEGATDVEAATVELGTPVAARVPATIDLTVRTGRGVRFAWPSQDIPILRSSFATGQVVQLAVDTRENTLALRGDVAIQSGDVFYFDRNFLIRDGAISLDETEERFDPRISVRAEIREASPDGPVRIFLVAEEERLSDFTPRFESNPSLETTDIVAILGGNIFETSSDGSVSLSNALLSTSDIVTQFGLFRQFEESVREELELDLFAVRTSLIQNVLVSAINPADETAVQIAPSLGGYLNNTSIFAGRYIGEEVFGRLLVELQSDTDPSAPVGSGIQRVGGVLIESEIGLEWQTPFFLLEWNFAPQNIEELFVRDSTFTLSWSFSY